MSKKAKAQIKHGFFLSKKDLNRLARNQNHAHPLPSGLESGSVQMPLWMTILLLGSIVSATVTEAKTFPKEGSYSDQKKHIDSLTATCTDEPVIKVLNQAARSPLKVEPDAVPMGVRYEVWKHTLFKADNTAMRRHVKISTDRHDGSKTKVDTTEIFIGSEGNEGAFLHKFKLNEDGDWTPAGKEKKSMADFAKEMQEPEAYTSRAGLVSENEELSCYNPT